MKFKTLDWIDGALHMMDQRLLPNKVENVVLHTFEEVSESIKNLTVRGAPAIGVAAAYGMALAANRPELTEEDFSNEMERAAALLRASRPTAVNLAWAVNRMLDVMEENGEKTLPEMRQLAVQEAMKIHREDALMCSKIGTNGANLLSDGMTILTHCNAGALATAGMGTALAVIYAAAAQGKKLKVYADETRPILQGARLTMWELMQEGIDATLITDNTAASVFAAGKIDAVVVGADRIAANGDVANKIGTYNVAVLAAYHGVPFYVAAPRSTFDMSLSDGSRIPIEERSPDEVVQIGGQRIAPEGAKTHTPAFDVTPVQLITAIISDEGVQPGGRA